MTALKVIKSSKCVFDPFQENCQDPDCFIGLSIVPLNPSSGMVKVHCLFSYRSFECFTKTAKFSMFNLCALSLLYIPNLTTHSPLTIWTLPRHCKWNNISRGNKGRCLTPVMTKNHTLSHNLLMCYWLSCSLGNTTSLNFPLLTWTNLNPEQYSKQISTYLMDKQHSLHFCKGAAKPTQFINQRFVSHHITYATSVLLLWPAPVRSKPLELLFRYIPVLPSTQVN